MPSRSFSACFLVAALGVSGVPAAKAQAGPAAFDPDVLIAQADANGDGAVTKAEFLAARAKLFARLDANGDGFLTSREFLDAARGRASPLEAATAFLAFDANHDGRVSRQEWGSGPMLAFDRLDTNHDGVLSASEIAAGKAARNNR